MAEVSRLNELDKAPVGKLLWKYSVPAVVGIVIMSIYNVIDRIFIGQGVGHEAIAGLAITFPVMNISAAFGVLIGVGASARISIVLGMGNRRMADLILGNSIVMTLIFGTFYIAMMGIFMTPILRLFGATDAALPYARDFMMFILPGLLMNNLCYSYNNVMRVSGYPTKAMVTMFIGAGLNVILAPIFIFGFGWGIKGAAIATDISMGTSALFVMLHFMNKKHELHFKRGTFHLDWRILGPILGIGAAPCIVNTAGCIVNAVINNTVAYYGAQLGQGMAEMAVASIGIFTTIIQLIITFVIGVCQGMQPIVGYNYGARKFSRLKRAFWLSAAVCTAICVIGTLLCAFIPETLSRMFTSHDRLIEISSKTLRLTTIMFWGAGFQIVATNFFQSIGQVGKSIFMSLTRQVLFLIPLLLFLPELLGLEGVWLAFPISDAAALIAAIVLVIIQMRSINTLARQSA
ncbi:MAG: MATE family efflux transporter [Muribaculaceae bacterium]|nr:MATE family efflux transporter [Muribaculaceae bacterium]